MNFRASSQYPPNGFEVSSEEEATVATPCFAYQQMVGYWDLVDRVRAGTEAVRELIPHEYGETSDSFDRRTSRAKLMPLYSLGVSKNVGAILRKAPQLVEVPDAIATHLEDVDLLGSDLAAFCSEVLESVIDYGYGGIFVDNPDSSETLADAIANGDRPYWVFHPARNILHWRYELVGNVFVFTHLRLREISNEPDGEWGEKQVERIRVYDRSKTGEVVWRLFEQKEEDEWIQTETDVLDLKVIPFRFVYTSKRRSTTDPPPLFAAAEKNVEHFFAEVDMNFNLHKAALTIACLFGYDKENGSIDIGDDQAIVFEDPNARAEYFSLTPYAAQTLADRCKAIEEQIEKICLSTTAKQSAETAQSKLLDRSAGDSVLEVIAQQLQDALDSCLIYHGLYLGIPAKQVGSVRVNRDFTTSKPDPSYIKTLSDLKAKGDLSPLAFVQILKSEEFYPDDFDTIAELNYLESEQAIREPQAPIEIPNSQMVF
jgi:hypothetical protein